MHYRFWGLLDSCLAAEENDRLRRKLAQANAIIDVQKKLCALLGLPTDETPNEYC